MQIPPRWVTDTGARTGRSTEQAMEFLAPRKRQGPPGSWLSAGEQGRPSRDSHAALRRMCPFTQSLSNRPARRAGSDPLMIPYETLTENNYTLLRAWRVKTRADAGCGQSPGPGPFFPAPPLTSPPTFPSFHSGASVLNLGRQNWVSCTHPHFVSHECPRALRMNTPEGFRDRRSFRIEGYNISTVVLCGGEGQAAPALTPAFS